jgi:hypothetical protein
MLAEVRDLAGEAEAAARGSSCAGLPWGEVWARVLGTVAPEDEALFQEVYRQARACPPEQSHGLTLWVATLRDGVGSLPEVLPRAVLEFYRDEFPAVRPMQRCEGCRMTLPANYKRDWPACPNCGAGRLAWRTARGDYELP